jgi:hypothetical protein
LNTLCFYTEYIIKIMYINNVTVDANTTLFHLLENIKHLYFLRPFFLSIIQLHILYLVRNDEKSNTKDHFFGSVYYYFIIGLKKYLMLFGQKKWPYTEVFCLSMYDPGLGVA